MHSTYLYICLVGCNPDGFLFLRHGVYMDVTRIMRLCGAGKIGSVVESVLCALYHFALKTYISRALMLIRTRFPSSPARNGEACRAFIGVWPSFRAIVSRTLRPSHLCYVRGRVHREWIYIYVYICILYETRFAAKSHCRIASPASFQLLGRSSIVDWFVKPNL